MHSERNLWDCPDNTLVCKNRLSKTTTLYIFWSIIAVVSTYVIWHNFKRSAMLLGVAVHKKRRICKTSVWSLLELSPQIKTLWMRGGTWGRTIILRPHLDHHSCTDSSAVLYYGTCFQFSLNAGRLSATGNILNSSSEAIRKCLSGTDAHKIPVTLCTWLCSTQQNMLTAAAIRIFNITSFPAFDHPPEFQNHLLRISVERARKHLLRRVQKHGLFWISDSTYCVVLCTVCV